MEYSEFKNLVRSKSVQRKTASFDDDLLPLQVQTGIKFIAQRTVPLRLVTADKTGITIFRKLDDSTYIRMPDKPSSPEDQIDIDEVLLDALAFYVVAGYERTQAKIHMGMCHQEIDANNVRLIESEQGLDDGGYTGTWDYADVSSPHDWYE